MPTMAPRRHSHSLTHPPWVFPPTTHYRPIRCLYGLLFTMSIACVTVSHDNPGFCTESPPHMWEGIPLFHVIVINVTRKENVVRILAANHILNAHMCIVIIHRIIHFIKNKYP